MPSIDHGRAVGLAFLTSGLSVASGLVTTLVVYRQVVTHAGVLEFGAFSVLLSLVSYLTIVEFGLNYTSSRQLARAFALDSKADFAEVLSACAVANVMLAVAVVGTGIGISRVLPTMGGDKWNALREHMNVWWWLVAWQAITFPFRTFHNVLYATGRQWISNILAVLTSLCGSGITLLLIFFGGGIESLPKGSAFAAAAGGVVVFVIMARSGPRAYLRIGAVRWRTVSAILSLNVWLMLGGILWTIQGTADQWFALRILGPAAAGGLFLLYRFPALAGNLLGRLVDSASPTISALAAIDSDGERVSLVIRRLMNTIYAGVIIIVGCWAALGGDIVTVWMKGRVASSSWLIFCVGVASVSNLPLLLLVDRWIAAGRMRGYCGILAAHVSTKLVLLWIGLNRLGLIAVPLSLLLVIPLTTYVEFWRLTRARLLRSAGFGGDAVRALVVGVMFCSVAMATAGSTNQWPPGWRRPALGLAVSLAGSITTVMVVLRDEDRRRMLRAVLPVSRSEVGS